MTLVLSEEQIALRDSVRGLLSEKCTSEYLRSRSASESAHDQNLRRDINNLGLREYFCDPQSTMRDLVLVAGECGRAVLPEPLVDELLLGPLLPRMIEATVWAEIRSLLTRPLDDELRAGSAQAARAPCIDGSSADLQFRGEGRHARVTGILRFVALPESTGLMFFHSHGRSYLADLKTGKEQRVQYSVEATLDRTEKRQAVHLQNVGAYLLDRQHIEKLCDSHRFLKVAEAAGAAQRALEMTVEYVKTRKQFGVPVGGFQAVQHRLAEMHLQSEALQSLIDFAGWAFDHSPEQFSLASLSAVQLAKEAAPFIVENAIQLHGGIGFTWEHDLHLLLRRVKTIEALFGYRPSDGERLLAVAG